MDSISIFQMHKQLLQEVSITVGSKQVNESYFYEQRLNDPIFFIPHIKYFTKQFIKYYSKESLEMKYLETDTRGNKALLLLSIMSLESQIICLILSNRKNNPKGYSLNALLFYIKSNILILTFLFYSQSSFTNLYEYPILQHALITSFN